MFHLLRYCARWAKSYRRPTPQKPARLRPVVEDLEERLVPSTYTVNSTGDTGATGTLRWAIQQSDDYSGQTNVINFNLGVNNEISLNSALPAITTPVQINGFSNPHTGAAGFGFVILDGSHVHGDANGLVLDAGGCTINGLDIINWGGTGMVVNSAGNNIVGDEFGLLEGGSLPSGNGNGIALDGKGATQNYIGNGSFEEADVISGNKGDGVIIDSGASDNYIMNDFIGTNSNGTGAFANGNDGIHIGGGSTSNYIGLEQEGTVWGDVISGNKNAGVEISDNGTTGNMVIGSEIGTNKDGTYAIANGTGVLIYDDAYNNTIGGDPNDNGQVPNVFGNVISGNTQDGIVINYDASGNTVEGNLIGVNKADTKTLGNGQDGVVISTDSNDNFIGIAQAGDGNVISGNGDSGIVILSYSTGNQVLNNQIGTDQTGTIKLGNTDDGIQIQANDNYVGSGTAAGRNLISSNHDGIIITNYSSGSFVEGNYIGTNLQGNKAMPNDKSGVELNDNAAQNTIGGDTIGDQNLISGNKVDGVLIDGLANRNHVEGNLIGTNALQTKSLGNGRDGVEITTQAYGNTIGGTEASEGNVISGNHHDGVVFLTGATENSVEFNFIGTTFDSGAVMGNGDDGVFIGEGAFNNSIGNYLENIEGHESPIGNVISGNKGNGVEIDGNGTTGNTVLGNRIGTDMTGAVAMPNDASGVAIEEGASDNTIGSDVGGLGNVISGNTGDGVLLLDAGTTKNTVLGNTIGANLSQTGALPNGNTGITIASGAANNTIGGTAVADGNVIGGNTTFGIEIETSNGNKIESNFIGASRNQTTALPNEYGIVIKDGASNNTIGGKNAGNYIANNTKDGVDVTGNDSTGNAISQNAIFDNGKIGIDLGDYLVTLANTLGGPHVGPNDLQNYPVLAEGTTPGTVTGTLNAASGETFTIEFFASATATPGQGEMYLGSITVTTGISGYTPTFTFSNFTPSAMFPYITATATDAHGNTSEFSAPVQVPTTAGNGLTGTAGVALSGVLVNFNPGFSAPVGAFTATINWGDATSVSSTKGTNLQFDTSPGTITAGGNGFSVAGTHTYADPGVYDVIVTITGPDGFSTTVDTTITVLGATN